MALKNSQAITFVDEGGDEIQIQKHSEWGFRISIAGEDDDHDSVVPYFEMEPEDVRTLIKFLQDGLAEMDF